MEYKDTLNLPKTDFPMKAGLATREPDILKKWDGIYQRLMHERKKAKTFILHDGPPYANGHVHIGTAFNKILKDVVVKSRAMMGFRTPFVPGWDCHGMPIEHQVLKNMGGAAAKEANHMDIRLKCREYANKFFNIQREDFKRLGCIGDWENPYMTMSTSYEASILGALADLVKDGYIYRGLRPIHWCATCSTALAEAEVEYNDHKSPSIYVKFKVDGESPFGKDVYFVIWTTTPWTIPANLAIALHPDFDYVSFDYYGKTLVVAESLLNGVKEAWNIEGDIEIKAKVKGAELEGLKTKHPLIDRESVIILGDHVTAETGTGCVHTAPGHGAEDFEVGKKYNLEVLNPVDGRGNFTKEVKIDSLIGKNIFNSNKTIVEMLNHAGALILSHEVSHSYPHCWRCKQPLIFRATEQWFLNVDHKSLRQKALKEIDNAQWIPKWGHDRMYNMVETRPDWCLSRQRYWGVPIPALDCKKCGETVLDYKVITKVKEEVTKHGADIWFDWGVEKFLPKGFKCKCGAAEFTKHTDILDVWFDSSVSQRAVLEEGPALGWPCDLYLEAVDQHRGWFQVSLLTAIANRGSAPYKAVLTHGLILDESQRKMSKSLGNVIAPEEVIKKYGADILRLLLASVDYTTDISFSNNMLELTSETYRKIRNTCRYLLSNLHDFNPEKNAVKDSELAEIDKWALHRLQRLTQRLRQAYEKYEFHVVYHGLNEFCTVAMSAFYLDILKDRLYCEKTDGVLRRSAQTVLWKILDTLTRMMAPVLSFTAEDIWNFSPKYKGMAELALLSQLPEIEKKYVDDKLARKWEKFIMVRSEVSKLLERARKDKMIGNSLGACVMLECEGEIRTFLEDFGADLADLFIVSKVEFGKATGEYSGAAEGFMDLKIGVVKAVGTKCARCWKLLEDVGSNPKHPEICGRCARVVG